MMHPTSHLRGVLRNAGVESGVRTLGAKTTGRESYVAVFPADEQRAKTALEVVVREYGLPVLEEVTREPDCVEWLVRWPAGMSPRGAGRRRVHVPEVQAR